jgi:hypothetical protein
MGDVVTSGLPLAAQQELTSALACLRHTGAVVRAADFLGRLLGRAGDMALRRAGLNTPGALTPIAEIVLERAYAVAITGLAPTSAVPAWQSTRGSLPAVALSGLAGGFAGLPGFFPDAAFTTLVILRDIARIAREHGEDLSTEEARAACVQVLSLRSGDERGYYSARLMLEGTTARTLLASIAGRWGSVLGEKFAAGAVPLAGAAAAATLNAAFLDHYRRLAIGHFTIRRLERAHGREVVRAAAGFVENPDEDAPFLAA